MNFIKALCLFVKLYVVSYIGLYSQQLQKLNSGWYCKAFHEVTISDEELTGKHKINISDWFPATAPGTVWTSLLENDNISDPFYGM